MPERTLAEYLGREPVLACRLRSDGTIEASAGAFLAEVFRAGRDILELCPFLVGTLDALAQGERLRLDGMHLAPDGDGYDGSGYVIDCELNRDASGAVTLVLRDQTERYRAVNLLSQQRNEADILKHRLERQNETLGLLQQAARAALETRTQFLATISHDIRTPLNALLGYVDMLSPENTDPAQKERVQNIRAAGEHLAALFTDIMDLSRIESGRYHLTRKPFELREMLEGVVGVNRGAAESRGLALDLQLANGLPRRVIGDALRISQVLGNLVSNAIKFTDSGGVNLSVAPGNSTDATVNLEFAVRDTGRGIADEQQSEIFNPFGQVDPEADSARGGSGLGLAIVRQLVEVMGGAIQVESRVGLGSTFTVFLPLGIVAGDGGGSADSPGPDREAPTVDDDGALSGRCILLAEDDSLNRRYVSEMLRGAGAQVLEVANGDDALQRVMTEPVDLVLLDQRMPGLDGAATLDHIRRQLPFPLRALPVIFLTGRTDDGEHAQLANAGAHAVVTKPCRAAHLIGVIQSILQAQATVKSDVRVDALEGEDIDRDMIALYKKNVPVYVRDMLLCLYAQDEAGFVFQAHKLQSAMWVMEMMAQYEILERLENQPLSFDERLTLCREVGEAVADSLAPAGS